MTFFFDSVSFQKISISNGGGVCVSGLDKRRKPHSNHNDTVIAQLISPLPYCLSFPRVDICVRPALQGAGAWPHRLRS
jgi:hypothetical protein